MSVDVGLERQQMTFGIERRGLDGAPEAKRCMTSILLNTHRYTQSYVRVYIGIRTLNNRMQIA